MQVEWPVIIAHEGRIVRLEGETSDLRLRLARVERRPLKPKLSTTLARIPWKTLLPVLYGILILTAALLGRISWGTAKHLLGPMQPAGQSSERVVSLPSSLRAVAPSRPMPSRTANGTVALIVSQKRTR